MNNPASPTIIYELNEQRDVRERVLRCWLPAWCRAPFRPAPLNPSAFMTTDWSFLTPGIAHWFLAAIDADVVEVTENADFRLGNSASEGLFEHGPKDRTPRPTKLRRESFLEIAATGMLALQFGWPKHRLRFQSPRWAFDLLAYSDDAWNRVAIAMEAKRLQKEAENLAASLQVCGMRGSHTEAECTQPKNHHRKYMGLLEHTPRILWIVGPEALSRTPDLVFRVRKGRGGLVHLHRAAPSPLLARN